MLCQTCQNIFRGSYPRPHEWSNHHLYVFQLERAASELCHICQVIWRGLNDQTLTITEEPFEAPPTQETSITKPISKYQVRHGTNRRIDNYYETSGLIFIVYPNGVDRRGLFFTFYLKPMRQAGSLGGTRGLCSSASWSQSIISARKCPTRLLQIGRPSREKIRLLLDPEREGTHVQYATLSHCWGDSHVLKLTSKSLKHLQGGIAISELGQTFQDAIFTAESLGIQFIWIDSLCILQDSRQDWQGEAHLMSDVYRFSTLNIAASCAADSEAGCFPDRSNSTIEPCTVHSAWVDCHNYIYRLHYTSFWQDAFRDMPLMKRGWVVQELLLAPRVLYLGGTQLFWECYEARACETYPAGLPPDLLPSFTAREAVGGLLNSPGCRSDCVKGGLGKYDLWKLWKYIVEVYSAKQLTYASDKLVAISGIVKLMEQIFGDQYCVGLWRKNLAKQLFWASACPEQRLRPRPKPYRAPSWSWASLDGPISQPFYDESSYTEVETLINITECKIESTAGDTTSSVTGGTLRLSGWLASMQLRPESQDIWSIFFNGAWWRLANNLIKLDCKPPTLQFHCLPLFVDTHLLPYWIASCLLLGPTGNVKGQFERLGTLYFSTGGLGMADWTKLRGVENKSWLEYEGRSRNDQYEISIIWRFFVRVT